MTFRGKFEVFSGNLNVTHKHTLTHAFNLAEHREIQTIVFGQWPRIGYAASEEFKTIKLYVHFVAIEMPDDLLVPN